MQKIEEFPKTLPWEQCGQTNGNYSLKECEGLLYAFYERELGFGFTHALQFDAVFFKGDKSKTLIRVRTLSSFCKMRKDAETQYLIVRDDYFKNLEDAVGYMNDEKRVYPPKRKPERIREMTNQEIEAFAGCKVFED